MPARDRSTLSGAVLCSGTLGRIPFDRKVEAAAGAGFAGISIYYRECHQPDRVRRSLEEAGVAAAELDGAVRWLPTDDPRLPAPEAFVARAAAVGARSVNVIEVAGSPPPLDAAAEAFGHLCDLGSTAGLLVHIEPFPWSGIDSLALAASIVAHAGRPNGGVLLDTWHLLRGPDRGVLPPSLDPRSVLALQISDIRATPEADVVHECLHDRLLPGDGAAGGTLAQLVAGVRAGGCEAPLGVEVFSDALLATSPATAARAAFDALSRLVG